MELKLHQKIIGHLKTVHTHRSAVRKNCFKCGLYYQGIMHDLSKYTPSELIPSIMYFQGYRSPYQAEKEDIGYSLGWLHHKGHNKHHWEYWYDTIKGKWGPVEIPFRYLAESVCDRVAASSTYNKEKYTSRDSLDYFKTRHEAEHMHPSTAAELEYILNMIAENGEEAGFAYIRNKLKENRF